MQPERVLRVEVDGQHATAVPLQGIGKIGGERRLAHTTLGRREADQWHG
jgi:hypothetical protein